MTNLSYLRELIFDALADEEIEVDEIYTTIREEVASVIEYHQNLMNRAKKLYDKMNSYQSYDSGFNYLNISDPYSTSVENYIGIGTDDFISFNDYCGSSDTLFDHDSFRDKKKTWKLPVEVDGPSGEYFITFPDELLDQVGWKEDDTLEWSSNADGSFSLKKVEKDV